MADSLSRLKALGLYEANDHREPGSEYGKSIFDLESEIEFDVNLSQPSNIKFEIKGIKYLLNEKDLDDFPSQSVDAHFKDPNASTFKHKIDMLKVKHLQKKNTRIAKKATKYKSKKWHQTLLFG